jgi:hypothetical protein
LIGGRSTGVSSRLEALPRQRQHLLVSVGVHYLSLSPRVVDRKKAALVTRDREIGPDLFELDICGWAGLATA